MFMNCHLVGMKESFLRVALLAPTASLIALCFSYSIPSRCGGQGPQIEDVALLRLNRRDTIEALIEWSLDFACIRNCVSVVYTKIITVGSGQCLVGYILERIHIE
jgi:hypothetical protein